MLKKIPLSQALSGLVRFQHIGRLRPQTNPAAIIFVAALVLGLFEGSTPARAGQPVIVAVGDSITAGFGLSEREAWPAVLAGTLNKSGTPVTMINAGVSGDTTAGGRARLAWSLDGTDPKPTAAIVALGGNDALRALDPEQAFQNLDAMVMELKKRDLKVMLAGMLAPPNLGEDYGREFQAIYTRLAKKHDVLLYPFLLDGVAADPTLNQADGIHPTADGQKIIADRIKPWVLALLDGRTTLK